MPKYEIGVVVTLKTGGGGEMAATVTRILADNFYELESAGSFPLTLSGVVIDKMNRAIEPR